MDKKLLVSVAMATPLAAFAQGQNWVTDGNGNLDYSVAAKVLDGNWSPKTSMAGSFSTSEDGLVMTAVAGAGVLEHSATLLAGTYTINVSELVNAKITLATGKVLTPDSKSITGFTVTANNTPYMFTVEPIDGNKEYKVGTLTLDFDFNFASVVEALNSRLNADSMAISRGIFVKVDAEGNVIPETDEEAWENGEWKYYSETAQNLRLQYTELAGQKEDIEYTLDEITYSLDDADALYELYCNNNLNLYNKTPKADNISKDLDNTLKAITDYNTAVSNEIQRVQNVADNTAAYNLILQGIVELESQVNNAQDLPGDSDFTGAKKAYVDGTVAAAKEGAKTALQAYKEAAAKLYVDADGNITGKTITDAQKTELEAQKSDVTAEIAKINIKGAAADYDAYQYFWNTDSTKENGLLDDAGEPVEGLGVGVQTQNKYYEEQNKLNQFFQPDPKDAKKNVYNAWVGVISGDLDVVYNNAKESYGKGLNGSPTVFGSLAGAAEMFGANGTGTAVTNAENCKTAMESKVSTWTSQYNAHNAVWEANVSGKNSTYNTYVSKYNGDTAFLSSSDAQEILGATVINQLNGLAATWNSKIQLYYDAAYKAYTDFTKDNIATTPDLSKESAAVTAADEAFNNVNVGETADLVKTVQSLEDTWSDVQKATQPYPGLINQFQETYNSINNLIKEYKKNSNNVKLTDINNSIAALKANCTTVVDAFKAAKDALEDCNKAYTAFTTLEGKTASQTVEGADFEWWGYEMIGSDGSPVVDEDGFPIYLDSYLMDEMITGYQTKFNGLAYEASPNKCYEAAVNLEKQIKTEELASNINAAALDYAKTLSEANQERVTEMKALCDKPVAKDGASLIGKPGYNSKIESDTKGLTLEKVDAELDAADSVAKYAACDANYIKLAAAYQAEFEMLTTVKNNYETYVTNVTNLNNYKGISGVDSNTTIEGLKVQLSNQTITINPAAAYYLDAKNTKGAIYALEALLKTATDANKAAYDACNAYKNADVTGKVNAVKNGITNWRKTIIDNYEAYQSQLGLTQTLITEANSLKTWLDQNDNVPGNKQDMKDRIDAEVLTPLADLNREVGTNFGVGNSVTYGVGLESKLAEIEETLNSIKNLSADDAAYLDAVIAANLATVNAVAPYDGKNGLYTKYTTDIDILNGYIYKIDNPGYMEYLGEDLGNNSGLQAQFVNIVKFKTDRDDYLSKLTLGTDRSKWKVLTEADVRAQEFYTDYKTIDAAIDTEFDTVTNAYYAKATAYWSAMYDTANDGAKDLVASIKTTLTADGIEDYTLTADQTIDGKEAKHNDLTNVMAPIQDPLTRALNAYTTNTKATSTKADFIINMNSAFGELDDIFETVGITTAVVDVTDAAGNTSKSVTFTGNDDAYILKTCQNYWTSQYTAANTEISNLRTELAKCQGYPEYTTANTTLNNVAKTISDKNTEITKTSKPDNWSNADDQLKDSISLLKTQMQSARDAVKLALVAAGLGGVASEVYNAFMNTTDGIINGVNGIQADLNALKAYACSRPGQITVINNLQGQIDNLIATLNNTKGSLTKNDLNADKTGTPANTAKNIKSSIAGSYSTVYSAEKEYANTTLLATAQQAFNNLAAAGASVEVLTPLNTQITNLSTELIPLAYNSDKDMAKLKAVEDKICALIETIVNTPGYPSSETLENDLATSFSNLDFVANAADTALQTLSQTITSQAAATGDYGSADAPGYQAQIEALSQKLAEIRDAFEPLENDSKLIALADGFLAQIGDIENQTNALKTDWAKANAENEKCFKSDAQYTVLNAELAALKDLITYANGQATEYKVNDKTKTEYEKVMGGYDNDGKWFDGDVQKAQTLLDNAKSKYTLAKFNETTGKWDVTALSGINADVISDTNKYVREALEDCAEKYQSNPTEINIQFAYDDIDDVDVDQFIGGSNAKQGYLDQINEIFANAGIKNSSENAADKNSNIFDPIKYAKDKDGKITTTASNAEQAKAGYQEVIATFDKLVEDANAVVASANAESIFTPGDVNLNPDGEVDITDAQIVLGWILANPGMNATQLYRSIITSDDAAKRRQGYAADVMNDKKINMSDVSKIVNMYLAPEDITIGKAPARMLEDFNAPAIAEDTNVSLAYVGEVDGHDRYAVMLSNTDAMISGQFDIKLPNGTQLVDVTNADRSSKHDVVFSEGNGVVRVAVLSWSNDMFDGQSGAIAYIDVDGNAPEMTTGTMVDSYFRSIEFGAQGTTITDMIIDGVNKAKDMIYDAAGRMYNSLQRGINIIRKGDGTTTKEIRK